MTWTPSSSKDRVSGHAVRIQGAKKTWIALGAVGFLLCVALAVWFAVSDESSGVAASVSASQEPPRLEAAVDACGSRDVDDTITLADAGATIVVDTGSKYGDVGGLNCLLAELNTPDSGHGSLPRDGHVAVRWRT